MELGVLGAALRGDLSLPVCTAGLRTTLRLRFGERPEFEVICRDARVTELGSQNGTLFLDEIADLPRATV